MSWQSYVDDQLLSTKVIKNAVIAGHDGNIWATSAGFNVSFILEKKKLATPQKRANFLRGHKEIVAAQAPTGFCEQGLLTTRLDNQRGRSFKALRRILYFANCSSDNNDSSTLFGSIWAEPTLLLILRTLQLCEGGGPIRYLTIWTFS